jgi:hypothetical protein
VGKGAPTVFPDRHDCRRAVPTITVRGHGAESAQSRLVESVAAPLPTLRVYE